MMGPVFGMDRMALPLLVSAHWLLKEGPVHDRLSLKVYSKMVPAG